MQRTTARRFRISRIFVGTLALAAIAAVAAPLIAHETWLLPASFRVAVGDQLRIDLTSGMSFPELESGAAPERVAVARVRCDGEQVEITTFERAEKSLRMEHVPARAGLATISVSLQPREIELSDEQVTEYFDEIAASASVREKWASLQGREKWRERYTKNAKTFVTVVAGTGAAPAPKGGPASVDRPDHSWREPVGLALEIVPEADPQQLRPGEKWSFRLLRNGSPLPECAVGMIVEGGAGRVFRMTDEEGRVHFTTERAGRTMLFATDLRRAARADGSGEEWQSDFTNLTFVTVGTGS